MTFGARSAPTQVRYSANGRRCQAAPETVARLSDLGSSGTTEALLDSDARPRYQRVANIHVARQTGSVLGVAPLEHGWRMSVNGLDIADVAATLAGPRPRWLGPPSRLPALPLLAQSGRARFIRDRVRDVSRYGSLRDEPHEEFVGITPEGAPETFVPDGLVAAEVAGEKTTRSVGIERLDRCSASEADVLHTSRCAIEVDDPESASGVALDAYGEGVSGA